jgi:hypothetical protein
MTHPYEKGGMCMSRCRCGATFSDPVHGEQPERLKKLREAAMTTLDAALDVMDIQKQSVVHPDEDHG